jgi:hypothetical protein
MVCDRCGRPAKGDTRPRRNGDRVRVYRHHDGAACPGWSVKEVPVVVLEDQVARLVDGASPNRQSAGRIRAALARPVIGPDRLAIARQDARLHQLGQELGMPEPTRPQAEVLTEMEAVRAERSRLASVPVDHAAVDPEDAIAWLRSLGALWRDASDEGRRQLALGISHPHRGRLGR